MSQLHQPLFTKHPEPGHALENCLDFSEFVKLLREEEDYWEGEQHNTKLIITRLRKIFYDLWGWNSELIRGAADIQMRYQVSIVDEATEHSQPVRRYKERAYQPKHRTVTYTDHDRIYGNTRVGQVPFIYKNDHQEVRLPDGHFCDIAHILAGIDAYNYPQVVTPFPKFLSFLKYLGPHVDHNIDIVTWLGDIASSSGDFLFAYLKNGKKPIGTEKEQAFINSDACGSDMLGDVDAYVISKNYDVGTDKGMRFTEILEDYYLGDGQKFMNKRCSIYCEDIGLKGWNGSEFANEKAWKSHYRRQLRDNTCFQVFSLTDEKLHSVWMPLMIWFGRCKSVLKFDLLIEIWLKVLKAEIKKEQSTTV